MQPFDPTLGDFVVTEQAVNAIGGEVVSVRTSKGTRIHAWRCTAPDSEDPRTRYFAHGHSLQIYEPFGYSIVSSLDLKRVLADEYQRLGAVTPTAEFRLRRDDILVWWSGPEAVHSALVEVPIVDSVTGRLNHQATVVSSKSGAGALHAAVSLGFVSSEHPSATLVEAYRKA